MKVPKEKTDRFSEAVKYLISKGKIDGRAKNKSIAEKMGRNRNSVSSAVNGEEGYFTLSFLIDFCATYGNTISPEWIFNGVGNMLRDDVYHPTVKLLPSDFEEKPEEKPQYSIPLIPTEAMAGFLSVDSVSIRESDIEDYYSIPVFRKSDFCIRVKGDSMEPKYVSGDIIACTRVPLSGLWFQWGKVYVIDTRQGALVKHIERGSDDSHIMLVSDNQRYKPFEIPTSEIFGVAIVDGLIRIRTE